MGRGKTITSEERVHIAILKTAGKSLNQIAHAIGRSKKLVMNCVRRGCENSPEKKGGRPKKLSNRERRSIVRLGSNNDISARRIKDELDLEVSPRTVRNVLHENPNLKRMKMKQRPRLSDAQKAARLNWCRDHMQWSDQWSSVLFSDERKFNLDGPDGYSFYWHDIRKEERIFSKRNFGGGSLMVWLGLSKTMKSQLYVVEKSLNSEAYQFVLETVMLPVYNQMVDSVGANAIFQQDKATCHGSHSTMQWLQEHHVVTLDWPANSPDLNIMENIWSIISREVYRGSGLFDKVEDLRDAIRVAWAGLAQDIINALFDSIPNRIFRAIQAHGGHGN
jgi:transposase